MRMIQRLPTFFVFFSVIAFLLPAHSYSQINESSLMLALPSEKKSSSSLIPPSEEFKPFQNGTNLGFQDSAAWIFVDGSIVKQGQYLSIRPVHLDSIEVFTSVGEKVFKGGDTVHSPRGLVTGGYTVAINEDTVGKDIYIRLSSRNILQPTVSIETAEKLFMRSLRVLVPGAVAMSISLFYLAWATSSALVSNNALTLAFMLRMAAFFITSGIHSGIFRQLVGGEVLPPQDFSHNLSALGYITIAQVFDYFLLRETCYRRIALTFGVVVIMSALTKFGLFISGEVSTSLQVNNATSLLTLALGLLFAPLPNGRLPQSTSDAVPPISRWVPIFYFLLQAFPLAAVIALATTRSSSYLEYADMAFFNYAIVPGAFIVYVLAQRQSQQAQMKRELQQNAINLRRERQAEYEKRRDIGNLLNMLTHEIKTPLATLQMAQAVGQVDDYILTKTTRAIGQAITQADRVEETERGEPTIERIRVDLCAAANSAASGSQGKVSVDCGDRDIHVLTDPGLLQIILNNLITNGLKYSQAGTITAVKVRSVPTGACVIVTNAMDKPLAAGDRVTEKYYRDPTNSSSSGTGLGLYIVKLLCDQLGHQLLIETSAKRFTITVTIQA